MVHDGARELHEISWQASPEWDVVSSELACRISFTVHLDSTFLGVHLDSTFLSSGPCQVRAVVLLVDTSKAVQEQQRSTGHG